MLKWLLPCFQTFQLAFVAKYLLLFSRITPASDKQLGEKICEQGYLALVCV